MTEESNDKFTDELCQFIQQLGIEVFNIERKHDHSVIELSDYGHHLCLYFHKDKNTLYFAPMDTKKILDPTKLADFIQKEFKFEINVSVTHFPKKIIETRMVKAKYALGLTYYDPSKLTLSDAEMAYIKIKINSQYGLSKQF